MPNQLVIYHGNCPDGFTAAWVAARALAREGSDVELFAGRYGEAPPLEKAFNRDVYVVDFSYPRPQLEDLNATARRLVVLDHHKTAEAELKGLPYCTFDMNRSGAGLTWDYFHEGEPRPWIVDYVEDRDLWKFDLPDSEAVSLRIRLCPQTLTDWDNLADRSVHEIMPEAGGAVLYLEHYVQDALRNMYTVTNVDGLGNDAACVNVSYTGVSDVLNDAVEASGLPMAIGWQRDKDGYIACSVRSQKSFDCSAFAKSQGGGGHAQAAGFRVKQDSEIGKRLLSG
jgi:oligoribonuclease NrnB/cAMP/cGMP phosphodiesterase (DHH superfamily)